MSGLSGGIERMGNCGLQGSDVLFIVGVGEFELELAFRERRGAVGVRIVSVEEVEVD